MADNLGPDDKRAGLIGFSGKADCVFEPPVIFLNDQVARAVPVRNGLAVNASEFPPRPVPPERICLETP